MNNETWLVVLGAILAIAGGVANSEFSSWRQRRRERKNYITAVSDDLNEIIEVIRNMKEVWEKTNELIPTYLYELESCMGPYKDNRKDLYLIKNSQLRSDIITFYRDMKGAIDANIKKAGSLSESDEAQTEQKEIENKFVELGDRAKSIKGRLNPKDKAD